ncbi:tRNA (guanosine(46)-N7)-methyltransferase TrmB [Legionella impletisoli]|uniref:tRNA (guanine-N(7)-)-methyltransferase n=1 Tax=Legionella impletisoli TaxID=343510 RepID=A0A917JTL5_9GAMM|nr:tRNA (guanosine(46)-N7)-methyltransferase TrmB [Legionella impletisoli]GGI86314.1 tRNA (guanine-N(7)-)-methyltransferase [Legionella impletisoli]
MQRKIKSYVLRAGRVSKRQQHALDLWTQQYELSADPIPWDLNQLFGREADTIVEIGFGMGSSLFAMAKAQPQTNFIGIEVHRAGVGSLVADLHEHELGNVRIASFDAVEVMNNNLPDNALKGIQIFFPDPWPKKRHHKRRLIQSDFISLLVKKLKSGGFIHCATDWQDYAEHMLSVFESESHLRNADSNGNYSPRPESRPLTKFEQRGQRLGHGVWDLIFIKR